MRRMNSLIAAGLLLFLVPQGAKAEDGRPFTETELQTLLVGKTYPLGKNGEGAFYIQNDGKLAAIWKGKKENSRWTISGGNKLCYSLRMFGGRECLSFLKINSKEFYQVYNGKRRKMKVSSIRNGKQF